MGSDVLRYADAVEMHMKSSTGQRRFFLRVKLMTRPSPCTKVDGTVPVVRLGIAPKQLMRLTKRKRSAFPVGNCDMGGSHDR